MIKQKLDGIYWLKEQIKKIEETKSPFKEEIKQLKQISPEVFNKFNEWTPLKLAVFNYTLDLYTKIAKKYFEKIYFIDFFAGSGINQIKSSSDVLIGSPFIALLNHKDKYTSFNFCEYNNDEEHKNYFPVLKNRINSLNLKNVNLFNEDCNICIDDIIKNIDLNVNYSAFIFVDPFCMEFEWESMKKILSLKSDILLTFMSDLIYNRCVIKEKDKSKNNYGKLDRFFGNQEWKKANNSEKLLEIYKKNILNERPKAVMESIKVISKKRNFYYEVLFITNKTRNDNKWMDAIADLKKKIESNSDLMVEAALNMLNRGQKTIFDDFNKNG